MISFSEIWIEKHRISGSQSWKVASVKRWDQDKPSMCKKPHSSDREEIMSKEQRNQPQGETEQPHGGEQGCLAREILQPWQEILVLVFQVSSIPVALSFFFLVLSLLLVLRCYTHTHIHTYTYHNSYAGAHPYMMGLYPDNLSQIENAFNSSNLLS